MTEQFSNNAEGTLAAPISSSATTITLTDAPGAYRFAGVGVGDFQRATITGNDPDVFEIVHIVASSGLTLDIQRGMEGTANLSWPTGATISARVTAGMLGSFRSMDENGRVKSISNAPPKAFIFNGRSNANTAPIVIAGYPALQKMSATPLTSAGSIISQDQSMGREVVGASPIVDLGDSVPTWTSGGSYGALSVVAPPTPDGYNYVFQPANGWESSLTTTTPSFSGDDQSCDALDGANVVGLWVPIPDPLVMNLVFPSEYKLVVSEVGFICYEHNATTNPSISVGTNLAPTSLASSVALSQITDTETIHRIPVTTGGPMLGRLRFTLVAEAAGNLVGRFYWRGFFVQF